MTKQLFAELSAQYKVSFKESLFRAKKKRGGPEKPGPLLGHF
jgi:hypothetical protein